MLQGWDDDLEYFVAELRIRRRVTCPAVNVAGDDDDQVEPGNPSRPSETAIPTSVDSTLFVIE
jgi:hypothetical protein